MSKAKFTRADLVFREFIKELRLGLNLTQKELAERLGLPQSFVSKYETGERRLDFVETAFVCEVLGMSLEAFAAEFTRRLSKVKGARI
ncbi:MAG: helix-turn-helix transcriptional regulator [Planctomycetes bacterium]|nr:helix-turn-helix transcriptional regulator [Planctomycetota bacterium]